MSDKALNRIRKFLYALLLLASILIQEAAFGALNLKYVPCIVPIAVVSVALFEGMETGGIFGLCTGCLWAWSGALSYYGAWTIVSLTVSAIAAGYMEERFLLNGWKTVLSVSAPALVLTDGLRVLVMSINGTLPASAFIMSFLPCALFSLVFCVIFYPLARVISKIGGFNG